MTNEAHGAVPRMTLRECPLGPSSERVAPPTTSARLQCLAPAESRRRTRRSAVTCTAFPRCPCRMGKTGRRWDAPLAPVSRPGLLIHVATTSLFCQREHAVLLSPPQCRMRWRLRPPRTSPLTPWWPQLHGWQERTVGLRSPSQLQRASRTSPLRASKVCPIRGAYSVCAAPSCGARYRPCACACVCTRPVG